MKNEISSVVRSTLFLTTLLSGYTYKIEDQERTEVCQYRPEERPGFRYCLHTGSLSFMKCVPVFDFFEVYLGGGGAVALLAHPDGEGVNFDKEYTVGFSGFPLVRAEVIIASKIGLYGEYQYHIGRTLENHYEYSTDNGNVSRD